jgi:L-ascorbate metabolism protein UlaG (beta-lactamase superfamily)
VVTTQAAAKALARKGFAATSDLRPWQQHVLTAGDDELRITSVPGVHGPGPLAKVLPPVMGSVLELVRGAEVTWRGYISGDTLYRPFLGEVLERCGPLDVLVPHLGGTKALGLTVTMDAGQGADLVELLKPPVTVPVHYDDYDRFRSPLGDFVAEVVRRELPGSVRTVQRGDTVSLRA